jgi:hypothetical protein
MTSQARVWRRRGPEPEPEPRTVLKPETEIEDYAELWLVEIDARLKATGEIARRWGGLVALVGEDAAYRLTPEQGLAVLADRERLRRRLDSSPPVVQRRRR